VSNHFKVNSERAGGSVTISCVGELDIAAAPSIQAAIDEVFAAPPSALELDWSGLTFMDSTGIRLLLMIVKRCGSEGIDLIWRLSDACQRALDAVGIHDGTLRQLGEEADSEEA
jgi:anti-anti-sigma factor